MIDTCIRDGRIRGELGRIFGYKFPAGIDKNRSLRSGYLLDPFAFSIIEINKLCFSI